MQKKISKILYTIACFAFFLLGNFYFTNLLINSLQKGMKVSNNVFQLTFVKNYGAAFSILQNSREILIILSVVALVFLFGYILKYLKNIPMKSIFFVTLLCAGISGNLHERITLGYVRDFFELRFIDFPVFNISDVFITIGVVVLIIMILMKKTKL